MGNRNTKSSLRNAIVLLSISADPIRANDDKFWEQIWSEDTTKAAEVIRSISAQEIRMLRDGSPRNFATLTYKMVDRLHLATETLCNTSSQQTAVINATRILIRIMPFIFEDKDWRNFFYENNIETKDFNEIAGPKIIFPKKNDNERDYKSYLPKIKRVHESNVDDSLFADNESTQDPNKSELVSSRTPDDHSLSRVLISSLCDLLFCPEFTVPAHTYGYLSSLVDAPPEDLKSLSTCDYVWEPGVGFDSDINSTTYYDKNRSVLLTLLLTCLGRTLYETVASCVEQKNDWIEAFSSEQNRHALPLFASLLNIVFNYNSTKALPFNNLFFEDTREELVELAIKILIATLDYQDNELKLGRKNLFIEYMSRIHRKEDFTFIIGGLTRLLNDRLEQGYLLNSTKYINCKQELLILNWKLCNLNRKFIDHLLATKEVLDIVIPILFHLNDNFQDSSQSALMHVSVFNLLILSSERNFGVRLNKPYLANALMDLPAFTGSHGDLMIIVFHKLILYGYNLSQLFDYLLTIIVNISPYLKTLSMIASNCLIQLFEIFSSPAVVLTEPNYHQLVTFLLEIFNNLIQYQFDGNANLIYAIINRKEIFLNLANMSTSQASIQKVLNRLIKIKQEHSSLIELSHQEFNPDHVDKCSKKSKINDEQLTTIPKYDALLMATPGIEDVTHRTNPFDNDAKFKLDSNYKLSTLNERTAQLSLDDILNQSSEELMSSGDPQSIKEKPRDSDCSSSNKSIKDSNEPTASSQEQVDKIDLNSNVKTRYSRMVGDKWKPTPNWLKEWKSSLPLQTIIRMIEVLEPQIKRIVGDHSGQQDDLEIINFLQNGTLVGLLPVPHPILIRKYHTNESTTLWFRVCTWSVIYFRSKIWSDANVKLIKLIS